MSSLSELKKEIKELKQIFNSNNPRFQMNGSVDELDCVFFAQNSSVINFTVFITDDYPCVAPVWFSESDNPQVEKLIECLLAKKQSLTCQVQVVMIELCKLFSSSLPPEVELLGGSEYFDKGIQGVEEAFGGDLEDIDDQFSDLRVAVVGEDSKTAQMIQQIVDRGVKQDMIDNLKKYKTGSAVATSCLKKEIMNVMRSASYKNNLFTVDLVKDSFYEWHVRLLLPSIDSDNPLHEDLIRLKEETDQEGILIHIVFDGNYPYDPPFVRVVEPVIRDGHVFDGVMCMELLIKQGWNSTYGMEALILELAAALCRGKGRVIFGFSNQYYSMERAQRSFKALSMMSDANRWSTSNRDG